MTHAFNNQVEYSKAKLAVPYLAVRNITYQAFDYLLRAGIAAVAVVAVMAICGSYLAPPSRELVALNAELLAGTGFAEFTTIDFLNPGTLFLKRPRPLLRLITTYSGFCHD